MLWLFYVALYGILIHTVFSIRSKVDWSTVWNPGVALTNDLESEKDFGTGITTHTHATIHALLRYTPNVIDLTLRTTPH